MEFTLDPTITPKMDGDRRSLSLSIPTTHLLRVFTDKSLLGRQPLRRRRAASGVAGRHAVQRRTHGVLRLAVWRHLPVRAVPVANRQRASAALRRHLAPLAANEEVREIRVRDLPTCSVCSYMPSCTRCPGLAYMEGSMRGPSSADCEKSQLRASAATAIDVASHEGREGVVA